MSASLRVLDDVRISPQRFGKYVKWIAGGGFSVGRDWSVPQGVFLKDNLKSQRPIRLYVEEFTAAGRGFWYYKGTFYEASVNNLSEAAFIQLCNSLR